MINQPFDYLNFSKVKSLIDVIKKIVSKFFSKSSNETYASIKAASLWFYKTRKVEWQTKNHGTSCKNPKNAFCYQVTFFPWIWHVYRYVDSELSRVKRTLKKQNKTKSKTWFYSPKTYLQKTFCFLSLNFFFCTCYYPILIQKLGVLKTFWKILENYQWMSSI